MQKDTENLLDWASKQGILKENDNRKITQNQKKKAGITCRL